MLSARPKSSRPKEAEEQKAVAAWLDAKGLAWTTFPGEMFAGMARRPFALINAMRARGVKEGVPDILVFSPLDDKTAGVAIELKRRRGPRGGRGGEVRPAQVRWLETLESVGWVATVCEGADEAIGLLERLYGRVA